MSCVYVPVFTIRLDLAFGFVCVGLSLWIFVWTYIVLSCLLSVLSCLVDVRNTMLCLGIQSCGIRARPRTHHVSHGSRCPWKHLLARRGYVELVPLVCIFLKPNGSETLYPYYLSQTGQPLQDHVPHPTNHQQSQKTRSFWKHFDDGFETRSQIRNLFEARVQLGVV